MWTLLHNKSAPVDANALTTTVKEGPQALMNNGVDLRFLRPSSVNGMHLAVLLRLTYTVKSTTPGWEEALRVAYETLALEGINPEEALWGLLDKSH